jgi:hypothetical protein
MAFVHATVVRNIHNPPIDEFYYFSHTQEYYRTDIIDEQFYFEGIGLNIRAGSYAQVTICQ